MDGFSPDQYALDNQGSLQAYLEQNQNYSTVQGVQGADQMVNGVPVPTVTLTNGEAPVPVQNPYAAMGVAAQQQPGQTVAPPAAPAQPNVSLAQFQAAAELARRNEQAALAAERRAMEAEENAFLNDVRNRLNSGYITEDQARLEVLMRHAEQLTEANNAMASERETREQAEHREAQERGKRITGMTRALNAGLNWGDPRVQQIVLSARDSNDMNNIIGFLASGQPRFAPQQQQQAQQTPAQVAAGRFAVPNQGRPAAPPEQRSGDSLSGYLATKQYQYESSY